MLLKYYGRFIASRRYISFHVTREAHDEARLSSTWKYIKSSLNRDACIRSLPRGTGARAQGLETLKFGTEGGGIHIHATARDQEEGPVRVEYKYTGGDRGPSRTRTLAIKRRVPRKKIRRNKVYRRTGSSAGRTGLLCCRPLSAHSPRSVSSPFVTKDCYCPEFYSEYERPALQESPEYRV